MVAVVYGGSREVDMMLSGESHPSTLQYLRGQMAELTSYVGTAANAWAQRAYESYNYFSTDTAMRHARAALNKVSSYMQQDTIRELRTVQQFQTAPLSMQRYLMAEQMVRQLYHRQECDGYSGSYIDQEPGSVGERHTDWRRVMTGVVQEIAPVAGEDTPDWKVTHYFEESEKERCLTLSEKTTIMSSWETLREGMYQGLDDYTSESGGYL